MGSKPAALLRIALCRPQTTIMKICLSSDNYSRADYSVLSKANGRGSDAATIHSGEMSNADLISTERHELLSEAQLQSQGACPWRANHP
jgi:hypothetical protein